jgi:4-hydroxy-3-polyprenylbenzoate decarboxylase
MRKFIDRLESANELIRIKEFVDPVLEITEITDRISKQPGGGKAILFEKTGTGFPVLINSLGSEHRICMALDVNSLDEIGENITNLLQNLTTPKISIWEKLKILPQLKEISSWLPVQKSSRGLCQQIVMPKPDLGKLPILKCWPLDGGRFVTLPLVNTVDPNTGNRNVGMYRMQVFSENTTGMHWHRHKTGARHYAEYKKLGQKMPVAVILGGDIIYTYAATAPLPENIDEYIFAGFLRKRKVELVKCLTQDIWVPSDADIVIEGYVDPLETPAWEGPFGDHTGFYSLADWYPTFHITCITHKKDAIYPATIVGIPPQEDAYIAKATERIFLAPIKLSLAPEIIDMNLPVEGVAHNLVIVKINKTFPGQAFKVMNALWGAGQMMFNKVLIVTSEETDIFSPASVIEACLRNANQPSSIHIQVGPADVLDHASSSFTFGGKICIDASMKMPEESNDLISKKQSNTSIDKLLNYLSTLKVVTKINTDFLKVGMGIIICGLAKTEKNQVNQLVASLKQHTLEGLRCLVLADEEMVVLDQSLLLWLILGNIDPMRDCTVMNYSNDISIIIDATSKSKELDDFNRDWPSKITSNQETIDRVNLKWTSLGLGPFINSPSEKFLKRH